MDKMQLFCTHIRAALACYVDMTPEQKARAMMYAAHKINALDKLRTAAQEPGGAVAVQLLQSLQQPENAKKTSDFSEENIS